MIQISEEDLRQYIGLLEEKQREYAKKETLSIPSIFKNRLLEKILELKSKLK